MLMMASQILKSVDFKKNKNLCTENETLFFLQIKKNHLLHIKGYFMTKNKFAAEVNFDQGLLKKQC